MDQFRPCSASKYLKYEIVKSAFQQRTNSEDEIINVEIERASAAGEGLISAVYRITVTGGRSKTSFVAKSLLKDHLLLKSLNWIPAKFFKREISFYTIVLPHLRDLQNSLKGKEDIQCNIPICYASHCDGNEDFILTEDMLESKCVNVLAKPTENERNSVLKVLAHIHAVSMALRLFKPNTFEEIVHKLPEIYFCESNRDWYSRYYTKAMEIDKIELRKHENPTSIYYKKFVELINSDVYGALINLVSNRGEHSVFNHGDAWSLNFMHSEERTVAIDFQVLRCGSPALDLSYFIIMCSNLCTCKDDFLKALKIYHDYLAYFLKDMGIDANEVFPWRVLRNEMNKYGKFGLLAALSSIPLISSKRYDILENFEEKYKGVDRIPLEELWFLSPLENAEYSLIIVNAIRVAVDLGLI